MSTDHIAAYVATGGTTDKRDWRRGNVERFRELVTRHFTHTPNTWKVTGGNRRYAIELPCGGKADHFERKRDAVVALASGNHSYRHTYDDRTRWYLQDRPDPRSRSLTDWELQVIREVIRDMSWWRIRDLDNVEVFVPAETMSAAYELAKGLRRLSGGPDIWVAAYVGPFDSSRHGWHQGQYRLPYCLERFEHETSDGD